MKNYNVKYDDYRLYLSESQLQEYMDRKRIEVMVIEIIKAVAELDDKSAIQNYLITILDENAKVLHALDNEVVANREYERWTLLEGGLDGISGGIEDDE